MKSGRGLYELIRGAAGELSSDSIAVFLSHNDCDSTTAQRLMKWKEELEFWEEYGRIYFNLEKARPYNNLTNCIERHIEPKEGEVWFDVGCGPLTISELIYEKSKGGVKQIEAIDVVLKPAREKLARLSKSGRHLQVNLNYASITDSLPYKDNFFDGIGANLILPYVIDFMGSCGKSALEGVLREMFRVLKPGGHMVWSTPKNGVNFLWVFIASIPDMLNVYEYIVRKDITRILQGTRILSHALAIQKKGKEGEYTFLARSEIENMLLNIGFINPKWEKTFTKQVWVNKVYKPI